MANTRFKTENSILVTGESNSVFQTNTLFNSAVTVNSATMIVNGALVVGNSATGERSNLSVTGDLLVEGNIQYTNTSISGDLTPQIDGAALGNTTNRFDGYFRNVLVYGYLYPTSNAIALGSDDKRWIITANSLTSNSANIAGNVFIGTNLLRINQSANQIAVNTSTYNGVLNVVGATHFDGVVNCTSNVVSEGLVLENRSYTVTNTASVTSTSQVVVDRFANTNFKAVKYFIYVNDSTALKHSIELVGLNAGADILQTQYGEVFNTSLGNFTLTKNANATDIDLMFTSAGANAVNSYSVTVHRNIIY